MPFRFSYLCHLLEDLEKHETAHQKRPSKEHNDQGRRVIRSWFHRYKQDIDLPHIGKVALLSSLFPERRTDRVYNLKARSLLNLLSRCLGLGAQRGGELRLWRETGTGTGDLASWTARIVKQTDTGPSAVTLEAIDNALEQVAARVRFSSPEVQAKLRGIPGLGTHQILGPIARHLPSYELKWFIRLILKDFGLVVLDESFVLRQFHFLLPQLLQFQSTFDAAVRLLSNPHLSALKGSIGVNGITAIATAVRSECLRPSVGVKIGRPIHIKARSIKQCVKIVGNARWSVEAKIDGEYCQVHVDLSRVDNCLQLFAKSGKDATQDRKNLHPWINKCLKIGTPDCPIKKYCILEGEMVVRSTKDQTILPFHKIRKHVTRSGSLLGTECDSQAHPSEQLIIIFYDCLLIDNEVTMTLPYGRRRKSLSNILRRSSQEECAEANRTNWNRIDFGKVGMERAALKLSACLADSIANRCEGLILKPCDAPYFALDGSESNAGTVIKLKKDYIKGMGDTADFAIIGGSRDLDSALSGSLKWTHVIIACLENKDDVVRFERRPRYRIMDSLSRPCIPPQDLEYLNHRGDSCSESAHGRRKPTKFDVSPIPIDMKVDVWFTTPFIADVLGSGFDKPSSRAYFMLRHPRILKLHGDRGLEDVVSVDELQEMASKAMKLPENISQEESEWLEKLKAQLKPDRGTYACSRSPFSQATTVDSLSTTAVTPTRQSKARVPVMVRMDSTEMRAVEQDLVLGQEITLTRKSSAPERIQGQKLAAPSIHCENSVRSSTASIQMGIKSADLETHLSQSSTALSEIENFSYRRKSKTPVVEKPEKGKQFRPPTAADSTVLTSLRGGDQNFDKLGLQTSAAKRKAHAEANNASEARHLKRSRTESKTSSIRAPSPARRAPSSGLKVTRVRRSEMSPTMPNRGWSADETDEEQFHDATSHLSPENGEPIPRFASTPVDTASFRPRASSSVVTPAASSQVRQHHNDHISKGPPTSTHEPVPSSPHILTPPLTAHTAISAITPNKSSTSTSHHPFTNTTIYLPPCVASHLYLTQTLLPLLSPSYITTSLTHWIRLLHPPELHTPPPTTSPITPKPQNQQRTARTHPALRPAVVPESQFAPTLRKVMLVESRRPAEMQSYIDRVVGEVDLVRATDQGGYAEEVEVWDWRGVEAAVRVQGLGEGEASQREGVAGEEAGEAVGRWRVGVVRWGGEGRGNEFLRAS